MICVMIFDIIRSRKINIETRSKIQINLERLILKLNKKFHDSILSQFMITLGDEFEGALIDSSKAYDVFLYVKKELNVSVRCGIGLGSIVPTMDIDEARQIRVVELDGPAFHRARNALNEAKKYNMELVINTENKQFDKNFNIIAHLLQAIINKWTKRQREYINYVRTIKSGKKIMKAAEYFKVTKQAVSKALINAQFDIVIKAEEHLRELLRQPDIVDFRKSISGG